uniref:Actin-related protein n=1 Tax=Caenorhabditis tropicalis TaxID=1561998 RepID=A0A1I7UQX3_9PELO
MRDGPPTTVILDSGGHNLKSWRTMSREFGKLDNDEPKIIPNSIVKAKHEKKRVFVGHQQDDCPEKFSLFYVRPIERGYVVNWDTQQQIWEKTFDHLDIEPTTSRIALTDNNHLVPALPDVSNGKPMSEDVINECKEDVCFVTMDFDRSMEEIKKRFGEKTIAKRYLMPDFQSSFRGQVQNIQDPQPADIPSIVLCVERFAVPEILFNPSDIDIDQCGVAEAVIESISSSPEPLRPALAQNIIVIGGSSKFPGFRERLAHDVRSMLPAEFGCRVADDVANAETHAWNCAKGVLREERVPWIDRKEWDERGESCKLYKCFGTNASSAKCSRSEEAEIAEMNEWRVLLGALNSLASIGRREHKDVIIDEKCMQKGHGEFDIEFDLNENEKLVAFLMKEESTVECLDVEGKSVLTLKTPSNRNIHEIASSILYAHRISVVAMYYLNESESPAVFYLNTKNILLLQKLFVLPVLNFGTKRSRKMR